MSRLADRLIELRSGEAQGVFAARLGLKQAVYCHYEKGRREPSLDELCRIAHILGTSPNELLGFDAVGGTVTVHGGTNAIGTGAKVNIQNFNPGESPQCAKCQYRKQLEKLKKLISP